MGGSSDFIFGGFVLCFKFVLSVFQMISNKTATVTVTLKTVVNQIVLHGISAHELCIITPHLVANRYSSSDDIV